MSGKPEEHWGLVANVKEPGTKQFVAGAKVFVSLGWWGDGGERVRVYGRHRGGPRYIDTIMAGAMLERVRVGMWVGHGIDHWHWARTWPTKDEASAHWRESSLNGEAVWSP